MIKQKEYLIIKTPTNNHNCLPHAFAIWLLGEICCGTQNEVLNEILNNITFQASIEGFLNRTINVNDIIITIGENLRNLCSQTLEKNEIIKNQLKERLLADFNSYKNKKLQTDTFNNMPFVKSQFELLEKKETSTQKDALNQWWEQKGYDAFTKHIGEGGVFLGEDFLTFLIHYFKVNINYSTHYSSQLVTVNLGSNESQSLSPLTFTAYYNGADHWSGYITQQAFQAINAQSSHSQLSAEDNNSINVPSTNIAIKNDDAASASIIHFPTTIKKVIVRIGNKDAVKLSRNSNVLMIEKEVIKNEKTAQEIIDVLKNIKTFIAFQVDGVSEFKDEIRSSGEILAYQNQLSNTIEAISPLKPKELTISSMNPNQTINCERDHNKVKIIIPSAFLKEENIEYIIQQLEKLTSFEKILYEGTIPQNIKDQLSQKGKKITARNVLLLHYEVNTNSSETSFLEQALYAHLTHRRNYLGLEYYAAPPITGAPDNNSQKINTALATLGETGIVVGLKSLINEPQVEMLLFMNKSREINPSNNLSTKEILTGLTKFFEENPEVTPIQSIYIHKNEDERINNQKEIKDALLNLAHSLKNIKNLNISLVNFPIDENENENENFYKELSDVIKKHNIQVQFNIEISEALKSEEIKTKNHQNKTRRLNKSTDFLNIYEKFFGFPLYHYASRKEKNIFSTSNNEALKWRLTEKPKIEITHTITQQTQQQTHNQVQQKIQRQQQLIQRKEQISDYKYNDEILEKDFSKERLLDFEKAMNLLSKTPIGTLTRCHIKIPFRKQYAQWPIASRFHLPEQSKKIDYFTTATLFILASYPEIFAGGIKLDNLPDGFYIAKFEGKTILDFNSLHYKNAKKNGLTLKIRNNANKINVDAQTLLWEGDVRQFEIKNDEASNKDFDNLCNLSTSCDKEIKINLLYKFISHEFTHYINTNEKQTNSIYKLFGMEEGESLNKENIEKISLKPYFLMIENFSYRILMGLIQLFYKIGAIGVIIVLDVVNNIKAHHDHLGTHHNFYEKFSKNVLEGSSTNSLGNFPFLEDPEYMLAFKKLLRFDAKQLLWFYALLEQHLENAPQAYLPDLIIAFAYFCEQLKSIHPKLELPNVCQLQAKNMVVGLDRLLDILHHAIDPIEQMRLAKGLNLDFWGAHLAVKANQFYLVTEEMYLNPEHFNGPNKKIAPNQVLNYAIDLNGLKDKITEISQDFSASKVWFFRYLGTQQHLTTYSKYQSLVEKIDNEKFDNKERINSIKNYLLLLCAHAITGVSRFQKFEPNEIDLVIKELLDTTDPAYLLETLSDCVNEKSTIILEDIALFIKIFKNLKNELWKTYHPIIKSYLRKCSDSFWTSLYLYNENVSHQLTKALPLENYLNILEIIEKDDELKLPIQEKLLKLTSIIQNNSEELIPNTPLHMLNPILNKIKEMTQDENKSMLISLILDQLICLNLDTVDVKNNKTFTLENLSNLLNAIEDQSNSDYQQLIHSQTHCQFDKVLKTHSNVDLVAIFNNEKDSLKKIIKEKFPFYASVIEKLLDDNNIEDLCNYVDKMPKHLIPPAARRAITILLLNNSLVNTNFDDDLKNKIIDLINVKLCANRQISELITNREALISIVMHMTDIYKKWPVDFDRIYTILTDTKITLNKFTLEGFGNILNALKEGLPRNSGFPYELLTTIIHNYTKNQEINSETLILDQLNIIVKETQLRKHEKKNLIDIILWLANNLEKNDNGKIINAVKELVKLREDNLTAHILLTAKIKNLLNNIVSEQCIEIIERSLPLIRRYDSYRSKDGTKSLIQFIGKFITEPANYFNIVEKITEIKNPNHFSYNCLPDIIKILSHFKTSDYDDIIAILDNLRQNDIALEKIKVISPLYDARPSPTAHILKEWIIDKKDEAISALISNFEINTHDKRDAKSLKIQFDNSRIAITLLQMTSLLPNANDPTQQKNFWKQKNQLWHQCQYINLLGYSAGYLLHMDAEKTLSIKDSDFKRLNDLINKLRKAFDTSTEPRLKKLYRLQFIAIAREIYFRTNAKFPYSTQILSILYALETGGQRQIAAIETGQGKSLISAMYAAVKWFEGCTVDICTSNLPLAQDGYNTHIDFFTRLGAKVNYIDSNSPKDSYQPGKIHYADLSNMALYQARAKIDCKPFPKENRRVLITDEADKSIFDDSVVTNYVLSASLEPLPDPYYCPYKNIYPIIHRYLLHESGKTLLARSNSISENCYIYFNDIQNLITFIKADQKAEVEYNYLIEKLGKGEELYHQLAFWLKAAIAAEKLKEDVHYSLSEQPREIYTEGAWRQTYDIFVINQAGAVEAEHIQFGDGVHNALRAKLNYEAKQEEKYRYLPEHVTLSSSTPLNFINSYNEVFGLTGTPGSQKELHELVDHYQFDQIYRMPPHNASQRIDLPIRYARNKNRQITLLNKRIIDYCQKQGRPILIICKDIKSASDLNQQLTATIPSNVAMQLIRGDETEEERRSKLNEAGKARKITIAGPISKRGTDVPLEETAKTAGGLYTILSYFPMEERDEQQGLGRSGRDTDPGMTEIIVDLEELAKDCAINTYLPPDAQKLANIRDQQIENQANIRYERELVGQLLDQYYNAFLTWWQSESCQKIIKDEEGLRVALLKVWARFLKKFQEDSKELSFEELSEKMNDSWQTCQNEFKNLSKSSFQPSCLTTKLPHARIATQAKQANNIPTHSKAHRYLPLKWTWGGWWHREAPTPFASKLKGWWNGNPKKANLRPKPPIAPDFEFNPNLTCYALMGEEEALFFLLRHALTNVAIKISNDTNMIESLKDWYNNPKEHPQIEAQIIQELQGKENSNLKRIYGILGYCFAIKTETEELSQTKNAPKLQEVFNKAKYIELLIYRIHYLANQFETPSLKQWAVDTAVYFRHTYLKQCNSVLNQALLKEDYFKKLFNFIGGNAYTLQDILSHQNNSVSTDQSSLTQWIKNFHEGELNYVDFIERIQEDYQLRRHEHGLFSLLNLWNWRKNNPLKTFADTARTQYEKVIQHYIASQQDPAPFIERLQYISQQPYTKAGKCAQTWIVEKLLEHDTEAVKNYKKAQNIGQWVKRRATNDSKGTNHLVLGTLWKQVVKSETLETKLKHSSFPFN